MNTPLNLVRGAVVKCLFPYDTKPNDPGPFFHYCLYAWHFAGADGTTWVAVAYGTSRLDEALLAHQNGLVLSVPAKMIRRDRVQADELAGAVTHWVTQHIAVVPESWIDARFSARIDFIREEKRRGDVHRQRAFELFTKHEVIMRESALNAVQSAITSGKPGLPPGQTLR
jgi:hypothetical protein